MSGGGVPDADGFVWTDVIPGLRVRTRSTSSLSSASSVRVAYHRSYELYLKGTICNENQQHTILLREAHHPYVGSGEQMPTGEGRRGLLRVGVVRCDEDRFVEARLLVVCTWVPLHRQTFRFCSKWPSLSQTVLVLAPALTVRRRCARWSLHARRRRRKTR